MLNKLKIKDLLKLPVRAWDKRSEYDSILIVPTNKKHDSGYHLIAIVGCGIDTGIPKEIASYCDNICIKTTNTKFPNTESFSIDMGYKNKITRIFTIGEKSKIIVGASLSSTRIEIIY